MLHFDSSHHTVKRGSRVSRAPPHHTFPAFLNPNGTWFYIYRSEISTNTDYFSLEEDLIEITDICNDIIDMSLSKTKISENGTVTEAAIEPMPVKISPELSPWLRNYFSVWFIPFEK